MFSYQYNLSFKYYYFKSYLLIRGGADKSLAQLGRKQATATKLGTYSTYSPWSSIHFLAHCSNFCKPLKKKFRRLSVQPGLLSSNECRMKNGNLSNVFSVQGTGGSPTGTDLENRVGDWTLEVQVGQFLLGCKCPVSRGVVMQEQDHLGDLSAAFFLQNVLQLHRQRWVILFIDNLALWKIINEEDAVLIPKNRGKKFSSGFLHSEFFEAGWATMLPLH